MENCFDNIVSLKGCNTEQPYGGYVDDVYVNRKNLASALDGICSVEDWLESKLQEVIQNVITDLKLRLEIDVKTMIQFLQSSSVSTDSNEGLYLRANGNVILSATIHDIRGQNASEDAPVTFYMSGEEQFFTGKPLTYTGKNLEFALEDGQANSLYEDGCCKPCNIPCGMEHSSTDGGFVFDANLQCDFKGWLCQFKDILIPIIRDSMRIAIVEAIISSSAVAIGMFTEDTAEFIISRRERDYNRNLKSALKIIREKAHDECCFDCGRFSHGIFQP